MTTLKELIEEEKRAESMGKLIVLYQIRAYIQQQSRESILKEIGSIWDSKDLNILIGAGMPGELYYAVIGQCARARGLV